MNSLIPIIIFITFLISCKNKDIAIGLVNNQVEEVITLNCVAKIPLSNTLLFKIFCVD